MATKQELIDKNARLTRQLAEREQQRLDNIKLSADLAAALSEIEQLKAHSAQGKTSKLLKDRVAELTNANQKLKAQISESRGVKTIAGVIEAAEADRVKRQAAAK